MQVRKLILVYNADWSVLGGLQYAAHRLKTGEDPCALCELTYDGVQENKDWRQCKLSFGVPVEGVYRNKLSAAMERACAGHFPCVLAQTEHQFFRVLGEESFRACLACNEQERIPCFQRSLAEGLEGLQLFLG